MRNFFILFFNFAALAFKDRNFVRCPKWILCGASGVPRGPTRSIAPQRATHAPTVPAVLFYAASWHWSTEIFRESHKMHGFAEKKVSRHKRGRCWRGGRKPVPAGVRSATRGMEPKGGTPQVPHKGHVLQQRSFGGKKPSAAKKKKKFTLNSAIFLCKALQTFEKFTKLCKLYMA